MSYQFSSRVRYSETDINGYLTLTGLFNYLQDCCDFQSESIGQGVKVLRSRNVAWMLSSWQVLLTRKPKLFEEITVRTMPYEMRGFFGFREFDIRDASGKRICAVNSNWVYVNLSTGQPQKVTEVDLAGYVIDERMGIEFPPRKIALPGEWESREPIEISRHLLDTNRHVNNSQYVNMAEDYLPENFQVHGIRVEYKTQGLLGDIFYPFIKQEEDRLIVLFNQYQDTLKLSPYAIVELTSKGAEYLK